MKLQCLKLFIMTKKNEFLEDFREISLVGSLKQFCSSIHKGDKYFLFTLKLNQIKCLC